MEGVIEGVGEFEGVFVGVGDKTGVFVGVKVGVRVIEGEMVIEGVTVIEGVVVGVIDGVNETLTVGVGSIGGNGSTPREFFIFKDLPLLTCKL